MVNRNYAATRSGPGRAREEPRPLKRGDCTSALTLRRRHAGKFTQPAQAWLRCRRLEGEGDHRSWLTERVVQTAGLWCPSCFETPRTQVGFTRLALIEAPDLG